MDRELRKLERKAACGDHEATQKIAILRDRARIRHPFLFQFSGKPINIVSDLEFNIPAGIPFTPRMRRFDLTPPLTRFHQIRATLEIWM